MKVKTVRSHQFTNALHLQFFIAVINLIKKFNSDTLKISVLFERLKACIKKEEICHKVIHKSDLSALKAECDQERDDIVTGMGKSIKSSLAHFDPKVCESAYRVDIVFRACNNPTLLINMPYDAETAAINNMLQELEEKYHADLDIIGLLPWVKELHIRNDAFDHVATAYNEQQSEKPPFQPKEARQETDAVFKDIVLVIDALIVMEGESTYSPFVTELNTLIKHYNDLLMQHLGRVHAKKEKEKKEKEKKEQEEKEKEQREKEQGTGNKLQGTDEK
jgi:hypothetical protein